MEYKHYKRNQDRNLGTPRCQ